MSITDTAWRMEAENLARAKNMVQMILQDWDFMSWNALLPMTSCFHSSWEQSAPIGSAVSAESAEMCRSPAAKMPNAC